MAKRYYARLAGELEGLDFLISASPTTALASLAAGGFGGRSAALTGLSPALRSTQTVLAPMPPRPRNANKLQ